MRNVISISLFLSFSFINICQTAGQSGRLESEYKLDIPQSDVDALWALIQSTYAKEAINLNGLTLQGEVSVEDFFDTYFDLEDGRFAEMEIGLRYRKRFKDGVLLKKLIQLKTPYSEDKVVRNEIKFEVDDDKDITDLTVRHPFLKHIDGSEMDRLSYELAAFKIRPEEIQESLKLKQTRKRVYIKDELGESVATITLDEVNNSSFPYQEYAELELELNEVRYTLADDTEKERMTALNNEIKTQLLTTFPNLKVDQRSKYRKMKMMIDESRLSFVGENMSWVFLSGIVFISFSLFVKDNIL